MTTTQLLINEFNAAIAEQGEQQTLRLLQSRNSTDERTKFILDTACSLFGIKQHDLQNCKQATNARRVVATVMRGCGYTDSKIQAAINKSKTTVYGYIRFMTDIEENPNMKRLFKDVIGIKNEINEKLNEYGAQRA